MNKVEKLIQQLCPEGVEYKELGEVIQLEKGKQLNKELLTDIGEYPAYNGGTTYSGFTDNYNYNENTIIISQGGASAGFVNFVTTKFYANAHCYVVLPKKGIVENKYVFHFLKLNQEKLTEKQHGAGIPALRTSEISKIQIPVPPLPIQQEIVNILDKFTSLEAELEAELEARRTQYEYYRNQLLTPTEVDGKWLMNGKEVEWKILGKITEINTGQKPIELLDKDILKFPYVNAGLESTNSVNKSNSFAQTITIPSRGQGGAGHVGFQNQDFWCGPLCYKITSRSVLVTTKFIYYFLKVIQDRIIGLRKTGSIPAINKEDLNKVSIPIPSLAEQERIVEILDKFDVLVNDISEGLPAEIAARRKQYEYYREKLLNFEPLITNH